VLKIFAIANDCGSSNNGHFIVDKLKHQVKNVSFYSTKKIGL